MKEDNMKDMKEDSKIKNRKINALPLRDIVIFPKMTTTILIGREKSIYSIELLFYFKNFSYYIIII